MRVGWWNAALMFRDLAEAIRVIWTMGGSPFFSHGSSRPSCAYHSYLHSQICLPSESILNRFKQWHYQELLLNHKGPPTRTCSIVPLLEIVQIFPPHSILPNSHPKGICSFSRPWCSPLNRIRASTGILVENFFFWFSPQIKVYWDSNSPTPSSTSSLLWKQSQETHEPFCQ